MNAEVGVRVHQVIAALMASGEPVSGTTVLRAVRDLWAARPTGGTVASSARVRCSTSVGVYVARLAPQGWDLVGVEETVGAGVADLIWSRGGRFVIDEVKSGPVTVADTRVAAQLLRLAAGGAARWGDAFAGVRLAAIASPSHTRVVTAAGDRLVEVDVPDGMEPR